MWVVIETALSKNANENEGKGRVGNVSVFSGTF